MTLLTRSRTRTPIIKKWLLYHLNTLPHNFSNFCNESNGSQYDVSLQRVSLHYDIRKRIPGPLLSHCQNNKSQLKPLAYPLQNILQNNQISHSSPSPCHSQFFASKKRAYTSPHSWAISKFAQDLPNWVRQSVTWELRTTLNTHKWTQKSTKLF